MSFPTYLLSSIILYTYLELQYCSFISSWISKEALERCKECIELIANKLQLVGFSRIDAFVNVDSGEVCWFHSATGQAFPIALCYITNTGKILAWIIELLGLHVHFQKKFCLPIINNATPDSFLFTTELFNYSINFHLLQVLIIEVNTVPGMTPSTILNHQVNLSLSLEKSLHQHC